MTIFSIALVLYLIMDPIGNIGSFLSQLSRYPASKKLWVTTREMLFALVAILIFAGIGEHLFVLLNLSETTVRLSSGVILFLVALQILFPTVNSLRENLPKDEPYVIPLAIPLTAGPSLLATVMLYSHLEESNQVMIVAIFIAWIAALVTLLFGSKLHKLVGDNGLVAGERLMGMILVLLAIQRFMEGVLLFMSTTPSSFTL
jgi:small neutral amino acid transporter SnatA (MarC family)